MEIWVGLREWDRKKNIRLLLFKMRVCYFEMMKVVELWS